MAKQTEEKEKALKKPLLRSPNHPVVGLAKAVEQTAALQTTYGTHEVPAKMAHKLWDYKEGSGIGDQCVAALKAYGLIRIVGKGGDRKIALTDEGSRIARNAPDRDALIRKAALAPAIHREIVKHYGEKGLPNDALLKQYLVWERPQGSRFNEDTVSAFINRFRKTLEFSKATESDIIGASPDGDEQENGADDAQPSVENDHKPPPPPPPGKKPRIERNREMTTGFKEDVFSLDEGSVVLQWPERLSADSAADLKDWLKLIGRKIERATTVQNTDAEEELDAAEEGE